MTAMMMTVMRRAEHAAQAVTPEESAAARARAGAVITPAPGAAEDYGEEDYNDDRHDKESRDAPEPAEDSGYS
jgi:Glu-tRNA(Gln) amidotransferase subunit E-like FAD-binding protein